MCIRDRVVLLIIAGLVMAALNKNKERNRTGAGELREQVAAQATGVQQRDADTRETEARAAEARAGADRQQAEAQRLDAEAQDKQSEATDYRDQHEDNLRRADEMDPDVDTKSDGYTGPGTEAPHTS